MASQSPSSILSALRSSIRSALGLSLSAGGEGGDRLTQDDVYDILSNKRRRYAIHYLKQVDERVDVRDLAEQVAAWENDKPVEALTSQERKRVYISLYQGHLSSMDDRGLVDYDETRGTVALRDAVRDADVYLEVVDPRDIPWGQFYLGLSAANALLIGLAWLDVGLFAEVGDLPVALVVLATFAVSATVQTLRDGRIRLGDEGPPPELRSA
ncbi:DUF7344 domain-containing protein [Halopenitus persicus]|jgi:hypothetical protein|uniref:DUF7344 domain-containing protein n=1 Tax=Halopenitus persicus TaxID=1048396 RepID=A0A1H3IWV3_9EURY|nr:hypothetical protein [Halopenitus persicus]QHS17287.1 hypothetical protein GWK26_09090 [haloarchaeon 3A1-DGR]SDY31678.1 hypothetical protein SAMN05216564_104276 [Halopenitus persicus]